MDAHSKFSASAADRWMSCPGSMVLSTSLDDSSSRYAAWGTVCHDLAARHLSDGDHPSGHLGRLFEQDGHTIEVDDEMVEVVCHYADIVRQYQGDDGVIMVEQRVNYSNYLAVQQEEAWGTADVIIARGDELVVIDLKTGMGVEVSAERNAQMSLYALGALQAYHGVVTNFTRVRMVIIQPRVRKAPSEWDCHVSELEQWAEQAREAASRCRIAHSTKQDETWHEVFLSPGEKQCRWCKAKATCPALRMEVCETVGMGRPATPEEFADEEPLLESGDWLPMCLSKVDLIEDWCKAVRAEAERRLLAGDPVEGFKLVQGKRGSRQWSDAQAAEEAMRAMRLTVEQMYDMKLISPTTAEKLAKSGEIGPRRWPKLQELITQSEGKPHVAPVSDPRPALVMTPVVDDFDTLA